MALTDSLVAYYKLDESSGDATDSSGNGYTLTNTNTVGYASALINNGADMGTTNSNKKLNIVNNLGITSGSYSVSGWVKLRTDTASGHYTFFEHRNTTTNVAKRIGYALNNAGAGPNMCIYFDYSSNVGHLIEYTVTMGTTSWYHCVATYDSASGVNTLYVNGTSRGTVTISNSGSGLTNGFSIGGTVNGFLFSPAYFDEVGVWSRALSSAEVSLLYQNGNGLAYPLNVATKKFRPGSLGSML